MPKSIFQRKLHHWYIRHKRDLPWRKTDDPYRIWLSEIILQQTRVNQGLPYYERFVEAFPNVQALADAPAEEVMKLWEGLGYYSRARNLHTAARQVAEDHEGAFPTTHNELLQLKGVGAYTAAAVASFVANEPHAVVDGNVYRVLARLFAIDIPINTTAGRKYFAQLAQEMLDPEDPATHNQAMMEFGALQCVPKSPDCGQCPLADQCLALQQGVVGELPKKERVKYDRHRYFNYLMIQHDGKFLIEQRKGKGIWRDLFQFPLFESNDKLTHEEVLDAFGQRYAKLNLLRSEELPPHKLSHQTIHIRMLQVVLVDAENALSEAGQWVTPDALETFAMPRPLRQYLNRNQLTLPFD